MSLAYRLKGVSANLAGQKFNLSELNIIGSDAACEVHLPDASVSPRHAELNCADSSILLRDLDSAAGTFVNGEKISSQALASGDEIRVGNCRVLLQAPGLRPERVLHQEVLQPARSKAWLWWVLGIGSAAALVAAAWYQGLIVF